MSNDKLSSTLGLSTAYGPVINIKSDGDQPDAAQAKLHATHSPVSDVASLSMSSTYGPSTWTTTTTKQQGPKHQENYVSMLGQETHGALKNNLGNCNIQH